MRTATGDAMVTQTALPIDPTIPALAAAAEHGVGALLRSSGIVGSVVHVDILRYKPGSRCVLAVELDGTRVAVKAWRGRHSQKGGEFLRHLAEAGFAEADRPCVPRVLGADEELRLLVLEWIDGTTATDTVLSGQGARAGTLAAKWLGALWRLPTGAARPHYPAEVLEELARWVEEIARAQRPLGARARDHVRSLNASLPASGMEVLQHLSFSAKHIIDRGGQPCVLDWANPWRSGAPELDAAMFLASLTRLASERPACTQEADRAADALRAGVVGLIEQSTLTWYLVGGLVKHARHLCTHQDPGWEARAAALLAQGDMLLRLAP